MGNERGKERLRKGSLCQVPLDEKAPYCFLFIFFVRFCIYPGVITGYTCVYAPSEEDGSKLTYDKVTKLHLLWQATTADWFPGKITEAGA